MGCECSQNVDENGSEVLNNNIEKSAAKTAPQVSQQSETPAKDTQRQAQKAPVTVFSPPTTVVSSTKRGSQNALFTIDKIGNSAIQVSGSAGARVVQNISCPDSKEWVSVQVGSDLFQVKNSANPTSSRWLKQGLSMAVDAYNLQQSRSYFALANVADRFIVASGGNVEQTNLNSVERFDVQTSTWEALPRLNMARQGHASCSLDGAVYVFCGMDSSERPMNSIEVLLDAGSSIDLIEQWRLVSVPQNVLAPRWMPGVAVLNDVEIAILGGTGMVNDETSSLGDVVIFKTDIGQAERVVKNYPGLMQVTVENNQCSQVCEDTVVAVGENQEQEQHYVVEFTKGSKKVANLKRL